MDSPSIRIVLDRARTAMTVGFKVRFPFQLRRSYMGCILSTNRSRPETNQPVQVNLLEVSQDNARLQQHSLADCYAHAMELAQQFSDPSLTPSSLVNSLQDQVVELCTDLAKRFHSQQGYSPDYYYDRLQTLGQELIMARQCDADGLNQRPASGRHQVGDASVSTNEIQPCSPDAWPKIQFW